MSAEAIDFHGLPAVRWRSRDGAVATATVQGAHLVSWIPAGGDETLFASERSAFVPGRAIRGGVPVCFPQFADRGPLAQHGFARVREWKFVGGSEEGTRARATFALEHSAETLELWPHAFRIELHVAIGGPELEMRLSVTNPGDAPFSFTGALHTYLAVADAATAQLHGLRGVRFLARGEAACRVEHREVVAANEPIDRIYFAPPRSTRLSDGVRTVEISQRGFTDTVVWNPGAERSAQMPDMAADGYRRMLCVEAAAVEPVVRLRPGSDWTGAQVLRIA